METTIVHLGVGEAAVQPVGEAAAGGDGHRRELDLAADVAERKDALREGSTATDHHTVRLVTPTARFFHTWRHPLGQA